jgi:hypothetical protein
MKALDLADSLVILGVAAVVGGVALVSLPAAVIVAGVVVILLGLTISRGPR